MNRSESASPEAGEQAWTVKRILEWTTRHFAERGCETPRLDAEILLAHVRVCRRIELYTRYDEVLSDAQRQAMRALVKRRAAHEPVAYLVGSREFYGRSFAVGPEVLIPRPDTETLVLHLLDFLATRRQPRALELGTGSGCICVTAAAHIPDLRVVAVDVSPGALQMAQHNAERHGVADRIAFLEGDLFAPVDPSERFDAIVSNPPYVRSGELEELEPDVRLHEPRLALDGGPQGMAVAERIIECAADYLVSGGLLALELSPSLMHVAVASINATGAFATPVILKDAGPRERVIAATKQ